MKLDWQKVKDVFGCPFVIIDPKHICDKFSKQSQKDG